MCDIKVIVRCLFYSVLLVMSDEFPSCQCIEYKGYCSCTHPVYTRFYNDNNQKTMEERSNSLSPERAENNLSPSPINTLSHISIENDVNDSQSGAISSQVNPSYLKCDECHKELEFDIFMDSFIHECYNIPTSLKLDGPFKLQEKPQHIEEKTLICGVCKKKYPYNRLHCCVCHKDFTLYKFRNKNYHPCYSIPNNLNIKKVYKKRKKLNI